MSTPMATTTGHHDHPPQPHETDQQHTEQQRTEPVESATVEVERARHVRRIGPLDRAALHLGVALIRWGRRPATRTPRVRVTLSREAFEAQRQAEALRDEYRTMSMTQYR